MRNVFPFSADVDPADKFPAAEMKSSKSSNPPPEDMNDDELARGAIDEVELPR